MKKEERAAVTGAVAGADKEDLKEIESMVEGRKKVLKGGKKERDFGW